LRVNEALSWKTPLKNHWTDIPRIYCLCDSDAQDKAEQTNEKKKYFSIIEKQLSVAAKLQLLRRTIKRET
jgi:hypothetical protein